MPSQWANFQRQSRHIGQHFNVTSNGTLNLAPTILEAYLPGYGFISRAILEITGFDIGILVSLSILLGTFGTAFAFLSTRVLSLFNRYLFSSIYFDETDDLFNNVLEWIAEKHLGKTARRLKAVSRKGLGVLDDNSFSMEDSSDPAGDELFHYAKWAARTPPKYEPFFGSYYFWESGRLFIFERGRRERTPTFWGRGPEEQHITIKTLGWNTAPIKDLLQKISKWSFERVQSFTVVRRPQSKEIRRHQGSWTRVTSRPSRPINTVVLDPAEKRKIIFDVNEYLLPSSRRWYATRGIPYRRGYLFHGPPGTGKSSLSFALAGVFGLDIYLISLIDPLLTESDLSHLFNNLPRRCIVLLEDIDSAGLSRKDKDEGENHSRAEEGKSDKKNSSAHSQRGKKKSRVDDEDADDVAGAGGADGTKNLGISLSGLLNAIDGVASHEGRVLVMTTNFPEKLDAALIRPGRVDMQIAFTLATAHQIREIFLRMYCADNDGAERLLGLGLKGEAKAVAEKKADEKFTNILKDHNHGSDNNTCTTASRHTPSPTPTSCTSEDSDFPMSGQKSSAAVEEKTLEEYTREDLERLAEQFAQQLPPHKLSPAEVQNFLILRKKEPGRALAEVAAWRDELLRTKEEGSNITTAQ